MVSSRKVSNVEEVKESNQPAIKTEKNQKHKSKAVVDNDVKNELEHYNQEHQEESRLKKGKGKGKKGSDEPKGKGKNIKGDMVGSFWKGIGKKMCKKGGIDGVDYITYYGKGGDVIGKGNMKGKGIIMGKGVYMGKDGNFCTTKGADPIKNFDPSLIIPSVQQGKASPESIEDKTVIVVRNEKLEEIRKIPLEGKWVDSLGHTIEVKRQIKWDVTPPTMIKGKGKKGIKKGLDGNNTMIVQTFTFPYYNPPVGQWKVGIECFMTNADGHVKILNPKKVESDQMMTESGDLIIEEKWQCGNAFLEQRLSTIDNLVWVTHDGRHSVWKRIEMPSGEDNSQSSKKTNKKSAIEKDTVEKKEGVSEDQKEVDSSTEENTLENKELPEESTKNEVAIMDCFPWLLCSKGSVTKEQIRGLLEHGGPAMRVLFEDGGRLDCLLNIRQALGTEHEVQNSYRYALMDYDLEKKPTDDYLVPPPESSLWDRLPADKRAICQKLTKRFYDGQDQHVPIYFLQQSQEVGVGRHVIPASKQDVANLTGRWICPAELKNATEKNKQAAMEGQIAHVLALYSIFENPLASHESRRSNLNMALDPNLRERFGYEIFAAPYNASVKNGKFLSKYPHVEKNFGSLGRFPHDLDRIPKGSPIFMNPPWSPTYLDHVYNEEMMTRLRADFRVRFVVPIYDQKYRSYVAENFAEQTCFVRRFWDSSAAEYREVVNPVLFWEDKTLKSATIAATSAVSKAVEKAVKFEENNTPPRASSRSRSGSKDTSVKDSKYKTFSPVTNYLNPSVDTVKNEYNYQRPVSRRELSEEELQDLNEGHLDRIQKREAFLKTMDPTRGKTKFVSQKPAPVKPAPVLPEEHMNGMGHPAMGQPPMNGMNEAPTMKGEGKKETSEKTTKKSRDAKPTTQAGAPAPRAPKKTKAQLQKEKEDAENPFIRKEKKPEPPKAFNLKKEKEAFPTLLNESPVVKETPGAAVNEKVEKCENKTSFAKMLATAEAKPQPTIKPKIVDSEKVGEVLMPETPQAKKPQVKKKGEKDGEEKEVAESTEKNEKSKSEKSEDNPVEKKPIEKKEKVNAGEVLKSKKGQKLHIEELKESLGATVSTSREQKPKKGEGKAGVKKESNKGRGKKGEGKGGENIESNKSDAKTIVATPKKTSTAPRKVATTPKTETKKSDSPVKDVESTKKSFAEKVTTKLDTESKDLFPLLPVAPVEKKAVEWGKGIGITLVPSKKEEPAEEEAAEEDDEQKEAESTTETKQIKGESKGKGKGKGKKVKSTKGEGKSSAVKA